MLKEVKKAGKCMVDLTVVIPAEEINEAKSDYLDKIRDQMDIPGAAVDEITVKMAEEHYGAVVLTGGAINMLLNDVFAEALKEAGVEPAASPDLEYDEPVPDEDFSFVAHVETVPEVRLGKYKGVKISGISAEVTEEDIMKVISEEQQKNAVAKEVADRGVILGDMVYMDFEGFIDGVAFEGGKAEDYPLTVGSGTFIEGFEEQLLGHNTDEEFVVNIKFDEHYPEADLAGKDASFTVVINAIFSMEYPEIDDEFASEVSDYDTLKEYKEDIALSLCEEKRMEASEKKADAVIGKIIEDAEIIYSEALLEAEIEGMVQELADKLGKQGLMIDQFLEYKQMSMEDLKGEFRHDAARHIESQLVLEAIAREEAIEVTEEDMNNRLKQVAAGYGVSDEDLEAFRSMADVDALKRETLLNKALELVVNEAEEI